MTQQTFSVRGMHCASCSSHITKKLQKLPGITECNVNFATEKANIAFDPKQTNLTTMNNQIAKLGYSLSVPAEVMKHVKQTQTRDTELSSLQTKIRFAMPISLGLFGLMLWDMLTKFFKVQTMTFPMETLNSVLFVLSALFLFWVGKPYLDAVKRFIQYHSANMDTLVGIGTLSAFVYSSLIFLFPGFRAHFGLPEYTYFDVSIIVIGFITFGKYLETTSKAKTGAALEKLIDLQAKTAAVLRNGKEIVVPITQVVIGDILMVKQGEKIPVDGVITKGSPTIDEAMISGEPLPKEKKVGDTIIGATINKKGIFTMRATHVGSETMLAQIVRLVENAQGSKAEIQQLADKISSVFVPSVLAIALVTLLTWLTIGSSILGFSTAFSFALLSFVGVLVIACPCALGLATPTAIVVAVGKAAQNGILIKNAHSLEKLQTVDTIVFDKTGTITNGTPEVSDIVSLNGTYSQQTIVGYGASLEKNSQHPLAQAIVKKAQQLKAKLYKVSDFTETEGFGVNGKIQELKIALTKPSIADKKIREVQTLTNEGKTVVMMTVNSKPAGVLALSDTIKANASSVVKKIRALHIETVMLTGDNENAAKTIAAQLGIQTVLAEVMPQDKAHIIENLQKKGHVVAMIGDGINDAPALTQANVGIALSSGTDIAMESADITLLGGDIAKIPQAIALSHLTMRTIKQNLFWAFIYNIIGIPLASGLLYPLFGIFLNPVFAGGAMAMSSVSVVANSLLLKKAKL